MASNYNPNVPTGLVSLDRDYKNLQKNFAQLNTTFGVDHTTINDQTTNNGYHKVIHLIPQATPGVLLGIGKLYATTENDGYANDQALYYKTGVGKNIKLTTNFLPVAGTNGYTFLPGGIVMQWGKYTRGATWPTTIQTILFATSNQNFANFAYSVTTTFHGPAGDSAGDISITSLLTTEFKWQFNGAADAAYTGFYWVAIGK